MEYLPVESATLMALGYDQVGCVLEVEFRQGAVYRYSGVPVELYHQLLSSPSKGQFFNCKIRNHFPFIQMPVVGKTI